MIYAPDNEYCLDQYEADLERNERLRKRLSRLEEMEDNEIDTI